MSNWKIKKVIMRSKQVLLYKIGMKLLRWPRQRLIIADSKDDCSSDVKRFCLEMKASKVMVIIGPTLFRFGHAEGIIKLLESLGLQIDLWTNIPNDPSTADINAAIKQIGLCDRTVVIAIGGGSVIDFAKVVAAVLAKPSKSIDKLFGIEKVRKTVPLLVIPTTAGSGSEATIVSVVKDELGRKRTIVSRALMPMRVILCEEFLKTMPFRVLSSSCFDAFCHATEAYMSYVATKRDRKTALDLVRQISKILLSAKEANFDHQGMALCSYHSGALFTKTGVGYAHAIAHCMGSMAEFAEFQHGELTALILPHIIAETHKLRNGQFEITCEEVNSLITNLLLKTGVRVDNKQKVIEELLERIDNEMTFLYPVRDYFSRETIRKMLERIITDE